MQNAPKFCNCRIIIIHGCRGAPPEVRSNHVDNVSHPFSFTGIVLVVACVANFIDGGAYFSGK